MRSLIFRQISLKSVPRFVQPKQMPVALARALSTYYTESHEYVRVEDDVGVIGVTAHAADALGDVVFVELPPIGTIIEEGVSFGSVESVKAASDLNAPLSGEVIDTNKDLEGSPSLVNEAPYGAGWFIKIKMTAEAKEKASSLMNLEKYNEFCKNE